MNSFLFSFYNKFTFILNHLILLLINFILLNLFIRILLIFIGYILSYKNYFDRNKQRPFECGFSIKINRRAPISLRFFLVALIFLIFDIELVLLFPYLRLIVVSKFLYNIFWIFFFITILIIGLFFEWSLTILDWSY
jgi:NADH-ubiquinone oxidoreductase chain 3